MPLVAAWSSRVFFNSTSVLRSLRSGQRFPSITTGRPPSYQSEVIPFQRPAAFHFLHTSMSTNGEARTKRRASPISAIERPKKQLKQENGVATPGEATPRNGSVYDIDPTQQETVPVLPTAAAAGDSPEWQATIEKVIKSVVSIHFCQTCSFDTDLSTSSQATGFVVDAERGYILTNRHVVGSGPFWGYCVFDNHEEVWKTHILQNYADIYSAMYDLYTATLSTTSVSSSSILKPSSTWTLLP
jgi:hypothetical protein